MTKYILIFILLSASVFGDSTTFTGSTYINDTYISNIPGETTTNFDGIDSLRVYDFPGFGFYRRPILAFTNLDNELTGGGQTIDSAYVRLYRFSGGAPNDSAFVLGKICKNILTASATWEVWKTSNSFEWTTDGCGIVSTDSTGLGGTNCDDCWNVGDASGVDLVRDTGRWTPITNTTAYFDFEIPVCHIDTFLAYPDSVNAIILDSRGTNTNIVHNFYSTEASSNKPILVIHWTALPTGPPDALHGVGGHGVRHGINGSSVLHKP